MKKFSEKLLKNWECGKCTVVKDKNRRYCIFSTKDFVGDLRMSGWLGSIEGCLEYIGDEGGYAAKDIDILSKEDNWQIVKTIDFSDLGGKGFQVDDKVRVIETGEIKTIDSVVENTVGNSVAQVSFCSECDEYANREIEPYFGDSDKDEWLKRGEEQGWLKERKVVE